MSKKDDMLESLAKFFKESGLPSDRSEYSSYANKPYSARRIVSVFKRFSRMLDAVKPLMKVKRVTPVTKATFKKGK